MSASRCRLVVPGRVRGAARVTLLCAPARTRPVPPETGAWLATAGIATPHHVSVRWSRHNTAPVRMLRLSCASMGPVPQNSGHVPRPVAWSTFHVVSQPFRPSPSLRRGCPAPGVRSPSYGLVKPTVAARPGAGLVTSRRLVVIIIFRLLLSVLTVSRWLLSGIHHTCVTTAHRLAPSR